MIQKSVGFLLPSRQMVGVSYETEQDSSLPAAVDLCPCRQVPVWTTIVGTAIIHHMEMSSPATSPHFERQERLPKTGSEPMSAAEAGTTTPGFDSPQQEVFLSLWRTYDRLRAIEDEFFREYELTAQQYNVLRLLQAHAPRALPTLDVANRLISRAPDVTRMLDKLVDRGLVQRIRSEQDRRAVLVSITSDGSQLLSKMQEPLRCCHERQLGHLAPESLRQVVELLRQIREPHEAADSIWR